MNFTPQTHLDATTRTVTPHDREGKPAAHVTLSRTFDTNIHDLWDAVTNPDRLPRWFTNVTGDLQLNGRYHVQDNASGTITQCEPQSHIALTWEFAGDTSWVELQFDSEAARPNTPNPYSHLHSVGFLGHLRPRRHRRRMGDGLPRTRPLHIQIPTSKNPTKWNSQPPPKASTSSPAAATHGQKPPSTPAPTPKKPNPPQTKQPPSTPANNPPLRKARGTRTSEARTQGVPGAGWQYPVRT